MHGLTSSEAKLILLIVLQQPKRIAYQWDSDTYRDPRNCWQRSLLVRTNHVAEHRQLTNKEPENEIDQRGPLSPA